MRSCDGRAGEGLPVRRLKPCKARVAIGFPKPRLPCSGHRPTCTVGVQREPKQNVVVLSKTRRALDWHPAVSVGGAHAAAFMRSASTASLVRSSTGSTPFSNRETVPWVRPSLAARSACESPRAFLIDLMSMANTYAHTNDEASVIMRLRIGILAAADYATAHEVRHAQS